MYAIWDDGTDTPFSYKIENGEVTITRYNEQNMVEDIGTVAFRNNKLKKLTFGTYGTSFRVYYDVEKQAGIYIHTGNDVWEWYETKVYL